MSKCPKCGAEVADGIKFCMECGEAIPQTKECPKCHAKWPMDMRFCQECGSRFDVAPATTGAAGSPLMGDKNVIAGDVNNSVSMSNSNNTTNVTNNVTATNTTNNVSNATHNVSTVTSNSQVTNNSTTNNTYIRQEVRQETELDKEMKLAQIESLRLEQDKRRHEMESAMRKQWEEEQRKKQEERDRLRAEAERHAGIKLEAERAKQAAKEAESAAALARAEAELQAQRDELERVRAEQAAELAKISPYKRMKFRIVGLLLGWIGLHWLYVRRWKMFVAHWLSLIVFFSVAGLSKCSAVGGFFVLMSFAWLAYSWLGSIIFAKKDGQGRRLS